MISYIQHMENMNQRKLRKTPVVVNEENWLNYTVEALQPLNKEVTEVMLKIADDMRNDLQQTLIQKEIISNIAIIGGLAANTHIKYEETIDILILFKGYQYSNSANNANYRPSLVDIILIRDYTKRYLQHEFPEALLDDSQPLALEMSTKSLPCNFCYYFGYENTTPDIAFGNFLPTSNIKLLNYASLSFEDADPVNAISELDKKDKNTRGNTRTAIRILKNIKADAREPITLTGHQISGIIFSIDDYTLSKPPGQILFILLEISLFVKRLIDNPFARSGLKSPDNLNLIENYNEDSFLHGINKLKNELDSLIKNLVMEIDLYTDIYSSQSVNH